MSYDPPRPAGRLLLTPEDKEAPDRARRLRLLDLGERPEPALDAFAERLAEHSKTRSLVVEQLRALVLVDAQLAERAFVRDFDASAKRMDLAGCHNLLDVLADPMLRPFVGKPMVALRNE
jgi:hypothetical protein